MTERREKPAPKGVSAYGFSEDQLLSTPLVFRDDLLAGKTVLVSGAGSGFGKAMAVVFARLGADVFICGRKQEKLDRTADLISGLGRQVGTMSMTIREPDEVEALLDAVYDRFGRLDVQINNAGGQFAQAAIDFAPKGWRAVIDTNLNGTWYMMQAAAKRWRDAGREQAEGASIVNIAAAVTRGIPHMAHTAAARAGVITLSKSVALEWAPLGIRVNCLGVGTCESSGFENYSDEGRKSFYGSNPMRTVGDVWDVAEAAVYLAAPSGKFITGETLTIDGGQQMWGDYWAAGQPDYFRHDYLDGQD